MKRTSNILSSQVTQAVTVNSSNTGSEPAVLEVSGSSEYVRSRLQQKLETMLEKRDEQGFRNLVEQLSSTLTSARTVFLSQASALFQGGVRPDEKMDEGDANQFTERLSAIEHETHGPVSYSSADVKNEESCNLSVLLSMFESTYSNHDTGASAEARRHALAGCYCRQWQSGPQPEVPVADTKEIKVETELFDTTMEMDTICSALDSLFEFPVYDPLEWNLPMLPARS
ncbi:MAG: hypothetical protein K2Z81_24200 [Cyanobacteria bacterium]|nr:hypothetical protein [Cyanobacteriota bacterium]